jgi:hypothetical protein
MEVEAFLSHIAVEGGVSASTQGQALAGLLFLYKHRRASPSLPVITPWGIPLRPTYWSRGRISARCKSYWATRM